MRHYEVCFIVRAKRQRLWTKEAEEKLKSLGHHNEGAWGQSELRVTLKNKESLFVEENNEDF
jgi:hypothetical protein